MLFCVALFACGFDAIPASGAVLPDHAVGVAGLAVLAFFGRAAGDFVAALVVAGFALGLIWFGHFGVFGKTLPDMEFTLCCRTGYL